MNIVVTTRSGTRYHIQGDRVRRIGGGAMRRDGEWLTLLTTPVVRVGYPMALDLEPLGGGMMTRRTTTPVERIEEGDDD